MDSRIRKSENIDQLAGALAKAQEAIQHARKDSVNKFFNPEGGGSKYASLPAVIDAVRPYFAAVGLSFVQSQSDAGGGLSIVTTLLMHTSGQWVEADAVTIASPREVKGGGEKPPNAQSWGSANKYGRRYSLEGAGGISSESDDDGNSATGRI